MSQVNPAFAHREGGCGGGRRTSHLRLVVKQAFELGVAGTHEFEAIEARDDGIYADGKLPADRPSQKRAWRVAIDMADKARYDGARVAVRRDADAAVAEFGADLYYVLYATAYRAARYVWSDEDIVDAVTTALIAAGHGCDFGIASPMFPIWRARDAQKVNDDSELKSFHLERRGSPAERAAYLAELNAAAGERAMTMER